MDKSILSTVIEAERDIQACIEEEEARLRDMIDQTKREAAQALEEAERSCGTAREHDLDDARREAEEEARAAIEDATANAQHLEKLDEGVLDAIIRKHLPKILME
jgi:vacuolar-type H+-ATPase subunit H